MIIEYVLVGAVLLLSIINAIISRNKPTITELIVGLLLGALYLAFRYVAILKPYMWIYEVVMIAYSLFIALTLIPKKITKNLTEYDYFELDKAYNDSKDEREKLRERYLSTINLIDEGVIFYENGFKDVFLSDKANELFSGSPSRTLNDHALSVDSLDRSDYLKAIERVSKREATYEIKYRVTTKKKTFWVQERGNFINVGNKKSIIAVIRPLDLQVFKETSYFDIDSLYVEDQMYPILSNLMNMHKPLHFVYFELSNIPEINKKYGRQVGSLMMNDFIKFLKTNYAKNISRMFRITGIRFVMILDDEDSYEDFHKALVSNGSTIYNIKIQIAGIKDIIKPNFGVVNLTGSKYVASQDLMKIAGKTLDEAIESTRRNFSIFGE